MLSTSSARGEVELLFKRHGRVNRAGNRDAGDFFGELSCSTAYPQRLCRRYAGYKISAQREDLAGFLQLRPRPHGSARRHGAPSPRDRGTARHTATRKVNEEHEDKARLWKDVRGSRNLPAAFLLLVHVVIFAFWLLVNWVHVPGFPSSIPSVRLLLSGFARGHFPSPCCLARIASRRIACMPTSA
jgi:hypothetical protein